MGKNGNRNRDPSTSWMKFNSKNTKYLLFIERMSYILFITYIYNIYNYVYSWKLFTKLNIINEIFNRSKIVCSFFNEWVNKIYTTINNRHYTHNQWSNNSERTFQHAISIINFTTEWNGSIDFQMPGYLVI